MEQEIGLVTNGLRSLFNSATDIFVDPLNKECEVKVSIDEYQGEFEGRLVSANIHYILVDYCDTYPFKYVFSYQFITSRPGRRRIQRDISSMQA
ncbi:MAG: hypothetical protein KA053_07750 [Lentimicrobiaceae bacterium]|nr:hypothetical protein [Lentimicrobiaceae bacterium]